MAPPLSSMPSVAIPSARLVVRQLSQRGRNVGGHVLPLSRLVSENHCAGTRHPQVLQTRDLLHSLGETASAWLQMLFASMVGKADVVMADEAALGGRKANRGARVRVGGIRWFMSIISFDTTKNKIIGGFYEKIPGPSGSRPIGGYRCKVGSSVRRFLRSIPLSSLTPVPRKSRLKKSVGFFKSSI